MGFVADNLEKVRRRTHLNGFLEEKKQSKVIEDQLVLLLYARLITFFTRHFSENLIR